MNANDYNITFVQINPRRAGDTTQKLYQIVVNGIPRDAFTLDPEGFLAETFDATLAPDDTIIMEGLTL